MIARLFSFATFAVLVAFVIASARPGPHRVFSPASFGLTQIAPRVWTDAPERADTLLRTANSARRNVADFFGNDLRKPNLILCTSSRCAKDFGIRGNGLSIAHVGVMVSPGGLTTGTLTHEMTHFRLHRRMGLRNIVNQPFPTWFDEGLATYVANHPRWTGTITAEDRNRVLGVNRFWKWDDTYRALGVGRAYVTAAREVAGIEAKAGRTGLLNLIARAEAGEDFETLLAEISAH